MKRRDFFKIGAAISGLFARGLKAGARIDPACRALARVSSETTAQAPAAFEPEYIVVGSGAGGGTVAARLVEYGYRVLVLEAGGDPLMMKGGNPVNPSGNTL